ncbi:MAG: aminotransferase class III-fold pyridoxal phosphate-dependent enzyme [Nitrosopumilus sp.]|uniref:aminotransferase class III-fold pyridoxal phosphate-dependent enzyme n=1 Tax=Nitrosopumilus sp. TaxID=2024843 RepID=UPI00247B7F87|nr:aminotransferase class III-fold pyridoxal phosphate-dependent enzyme [Nitrosopumilus sp.]MCV0393567.1 aminotransferase class III-fold pyridoxal phosphate-dependent enzyme [Nitrosopumilus sp.]
MKSLKNSFDLLEKAKNLIPSLTQTFSRSPYTFVEGTFPIYAKSAKGSHFFDVDDNEYIDYLCGLGPIILGHCYPKVDNSITSQLKNGILFSLPHKLEIDVSEQICDIVPSAEMVKFSKTGSGSATGAVRGARAFTKKDKIAYCGSGGVWHDWYAAIISRNQGVPEFNKDLIYPFDYNDFDGLEYIFEQNKNEIACVFMEPTIFEKPQNNFLEKVKKLTHQNDAVLIYDEIVTGFRFSNGGAQELFGVEPDITVLGKGMANGMPLSAVAGKNEYMKIFDDVFFSTTYAADTLSLAASSATISEFQEKPVVKTIWENGTLLMEGFNKLSSENSLNLSFEGYPVRIKVVGKDNKGNDSILLRSLFIQEMVKKGIFLHPGVEYISFSHTSDDIDSTLQAFADSISVLKKASDENNFESYLEGKPSKPVYSVLKSSIHKPNNS